MIKITEGRGKIVITGHAGYAPHGQDIVCAAISAFTEALIASVEQLTDSGIKSDLRPGRAVIEYEDKAQDVKLLVESFFIGVSGIAAAYPENVEITREGRPGVDAVKSYGR